MGVMLSQAQRQLCASLTLKQHGADTIQALFTHLRVYYQMEEGESRKDTMESRAYQQHVLWL